MLVGHAQSAPAASDSYQHLPLRETFWRECISATRRTPVVLSSFDLEIAPVTHWPHRHYRQRQEHHGGLADGPAGAIFRKGTGG